MLAVRKFRSTTPVPAFRDHANGMKHGDTSLCGGSGDRLRAVLPRSIHLYVMAGRGRSGIGPVRERRPVWSDHFWPLYLVLLFAVELHGGIGLYRLRSRGLVHRRTRTSPGR